MQRLTSDGELSGHPWWRRMALDIPGLRPARYGRFNLNIGYRLTDTSKVPMPGGIGILPWFKQPLVIRIPVIRIRAARVFASNATTDSSPDRVSRSGPPPSGAPVP